MDIETKLQRFYDVVRKEAEAEKDRMESELNEKYEANITEFEKKARQKYAQMDEDVKIEAEKKKQKAITEANADIKRTLIQNRVKYIDKVFADVSERLDAFFATEEYEKIIIDFIESHKNMSDDMTAFIMKRDEGFKGAIENVTGVKVVVVDEDFLGGVRISLGKSRVADGTFKGRFEAQRAGFNKIKIV